MRNTLGGVVSAEPERLTTGGGTMWGIWFGFALKSGFWVPSMVLAVASVGFARRVHSRASLALAVGSVGQLTISVVGTVISAALGWRQFQAASRGMGAFRSAAIVDGAVATALGAIGIGFALVFAFALLFVLRDTARSVGDDPVGEAGERAR